MLSMNSSTLKYERRLILVFQRVVLLGIVCALPARALCATQGAPLPQHCPPIQLHGADKGSVRFELSNARGHMSYDTLNRTLEVIYTTPLSETFEDVVDRKAVPFRVSFWPTDVQALSPSRWLVSGKAYRSNDAVIEIWDFLDGGRVYPPIVPGGEWRTPVLSSITELYRGPQHGLVEKVWGNLGDNTSVLVLFSPDHRIYELKLDGSAEKCVASPASGPGGLVVPLLAERWDGFWSGRHTTFGDVYCLRKAGGLGGGTLVLQDTDLNGTLETSFLVDKTQWRAGEWWDDTKYSFTRN